MAFVASGLAITNRLHSPTSFIHSSKPSHVHLRLPTVKHSRFSASPTPSKWTMVSSPDPSTTQSMSSSTSESSANSTPDTDNPVDIDVLMSRAKGVASDVTTRPGYYSKITGYIVGAVVILTILRSVVQAIDSLPVLPAGFELIGLGYSGWFIWRYILFRDSRAELLEEIDDFLGRTRPGGK